MDDSGPEPSTAYRYNEFWRCQAKFGEGAEECGKLQRFYMSLCPAEWVSYCSCQTRVLSTFHPTLYRIRTGHKLMSCAAPRCHTLVSLF